MQNGVRLERSRPRFFKEPTDEDIEANGWAMATINARVRARIIGSRVMAGAVTLGIGTAITAEELLSGAGVHPLDIVSNYAIPLVINGIAQIKVERQMRRTALEAGVLLQGILDANSTLAQETTPLADT